MRNMNIDPDYDLQPVYYNRVMSEKFEKLILSEYKWLIEFVKKHKELDFQTGFDQKQNKSWFSIYRGTSRILQITYFDKGERVKIDAAASYMKLDSYPKKLDEKHLEAYLNEINENPKYGKYYIDSKGDCKEGYYQTLIARRYTFENKIDDDFVIFDKELVLGFINEEEKKSWNEIVVNIQNETIQKLRFKSKERLPKTIKAEYGEIDFMGLSWDGDLVIMELKKDAADGLSPIQIGYYGLQFEKLKTEGMEDRLYKVIREMILQKKRMGLIKWTPKAKELPNGLSGGIRKYIIIGNEEKVAEKIKKRFALAKEVSLCKAEVYTCYTDGTLRPSTQL